MYAGHVHANFPCKFSIKWLPSVRFEPTIRALKAALLPTKLHSIKVAQLNTALHKYYRHITMLYLLMTVCSSVHSLSVKQ